MPTKRSYMCVSVGGYLAALKRTRRPDSMFSENGRPLSRNEAIAYLTIEQNKGHDVIPAHAGCGKPCKNSCKCAGFDYKGGGCPGYPIDEEASE